MVCVALCVFGWYHLRKAQVIEICGVCVYACVKVYLISMISVNMFVMSSNYVYKGKCFGRCSKERSANFVQFKCGKGFERFDRFAMRVYELRGDGVRPHPSAFFNVTSSPFAVATSAFSASLVSMTTG